MLYYQSLKEKRLLNDFKKKHIITQACLNLTGYENLFRDIVSEHRDAVYLNSWNYIHLTDALVAQTVNRLLGDIWFNERYIGSNPVGILYPRGFTFKSIDAKGQAKVLELIENSLDVLLEPFKDSNVSYILWDSLDVNAHFLYIGESKDGKTWDPQYFTDSKLLTELRA